jgi:hypothetical protein
MNSEDNENTGQSTESSTATSEATAQFVKIESYLASIRAASWLTAIGILALVVTQVV